MSRILPLAFAVASFAVIVPTHWPAKNPSPRSRRPPAASKLDADGKQTVTITLEIDQPWYIYANPMKANTDIFDGNETIVAFKTKDKVKASVKYPAGTQKKDGKYAYDIYQKGKIVIQAEVQRAVGDTSSAAGQH